MSTPWDTMLVDHDRLFSAALGALIANGPFHIGHYAATAAEALAAVEAGASPDLIVLATPAAAGEELAGLRRLRRACDARIAILADYVADRPLSQAAERG